MTYKPTVKYASHARITRVQKRGYADRMAGKRKEDNPYKNRWDRDNWQTGWWDAEIELTKDEELTDDNIPF